MDSSVREATSPNCRCSRPGGRAAHVGTPRCGSVLGGELAAEPRVTLCVVVVHTDNADSLTFRRVFGGDRVQSGHGRRIPAGSLAHVNHDVPGGRRRCRTDTRGRCRKRKRLALDRIHAGVLVGVGDVDDLGHVGDPAGEEHHRGQGGARCVPRAGYAPRCWPGSTDCRSGEVSAVSSCFTTSSVLAPRPLSAQDYHPWSSVLPRFIARKVLPEPRLGRLPRERYGCGQADQRGRRRRQALSLREIST